MTLTGLAVRNLARNKFRVILTALAVAITVVAFLLLRTIMWAWAAADEVAASDRVVTRHKVTFVMSLPRRYVEDVRNAPGITAVTWANWFGGKDPKHEHEFFSTLGVDAATYFSVYPEMTVRAEELENFKHDKQGAIVGETLMKKLGWKIGDKVTLESGIFPGDWQVTIDGVYAATSRAVDRSTLLFHWDYVNDAMPVARRDGVGWIVSRVADRSRVAEMGVKLDKIFDDRDTQTLSQDEHAFYKGFMAMFSGILTAVNIVSVVILVIMTLIVGNTIAMGARERGGEYGVLRAIGFLPGHVAFWVVAEGLVMSLIGGVLGLLLAWPFINLLLGRMLEENAAQYFPYFRLVPGNMILAVGLAAILGAAAAIVPAWRASKLRVVDAVRRMA